MSKYMFFLFVLIIVSYSITKEKRNNYTIALIFVEKIFSIIPNRKSTYPFN